MGREIKLILLFFIFTFLITDSILGQPICEENETKPCGSNIGICESGNRTCVNGSFGECTGAIELQPEICGNSLDENCNGQTDECVMSPWIALIGVGIFILIFIWILSRMI